MENAQISTSDELHSLNTGQITPAAPLIPPAEGLLGVNQPMRNFTYLIKFDNKKWEYFSSGQDDFNIPPQIRVKIDEFLAFLNASCIPYRCLHIILDIIMLLFLTSIVWVGIATIVTQDYNSGIYIGVSFVLMFVGVIMLICSNTRWYPIYKIHKKVLKLEEFIKLSAPLTVVAHSKASYAFLRRKFSFVFQFNSRDFIRNRIEQEVIQQMTPIPVAEVNFEQREEQRMILDLLDLPNVLHPVFEVGASQITNDEVLPPANIN